jgi:hypothetical protein
MKLVALAALVATSVVAPLAHADAPGATEPVSISTASAVDYGARSSLSVTTGVFTPVGEIGIEYTHNLNRYLEVGFSGGMGFTGPQAAVMPRLRIAHGGLAFLLGAGLSGGPYQALDICFDDGCETPGSVKVAVWANLEAGVQLTTERGFLVKVYAGAGAIVASSVCTGNPDDCMSINGTTLPYFGLSIGHTL